MHPQVQLDDSVDAPLHLTLSNVSLEENESNYRRQSPDEDLRPPVRRDVLSLGPAGDPQDGRRRLLLIYIHGFMGAEDSFRRFPAHVHNLVANALVESHVVYSKVYPRYKSRRAMSVARDEFSKWVMPHESEQTDIILLGHSLGGILAAEVALAEDEDLSSHNGHRHRILGTINFDVPFLGMHPGVVGTGLSALFQPKHAEESSSQEDISKAVSPKSVDSTSSDQSSQEPKVSTLPSWFEQVPDSNFDPPFRNDVRRVKRSQLDGAVHFFKKNSGNLRLAIQEYANSYLDFGGCLADYSGLRRRYASLKELEAIDDIEPKHDKRGRLLRRLRFVNYYTASPGFPKKSPSGDEKQSSMDNSPSTQTVTAESLEEISRLPSPISSMKEPNLSDESLTEIEPRTMEEDSSIEKLPSRDEIYEKLPGYSRLEEGDEQHEDALRSLPPLPMIPPEPPAFDSSSYEDKEILRQARREYARLVKLHERAQKEHELTLKEREKLARKLKEKKNKLGSASFESKGGPGDTASRDDIDDDDTDDVISINTKQTSDTASIKANTLTTPQSEKSYIDSTSISSVAETAPASIKTPKERVFCALPSKANGSRDPLWVRIFLPDVDEVVAHQSIFIPNGLYYEWLVSDTAARIEQWVQDDSTRRLIWEQYGEP